MKEKFEVVVLAAESVLIQRRRDGRGKVLAVQPTRATSTLFPSSPSRFSQVSGMKSRSRLLWEVCNGMEVAHAGNTKGMLI